MKINLDAPVTVPKYTAHELLQGNTYQSVGTGSYIMRTQNGIVNLEDGGHIPLGMVLDSARYTPVTLQVIYA
jgi:hypothetical protein